MGIMYKEKINMEENAIFTNSYGKRKLDECRNALQSQFDALVSGMPNFVFTETKEKEHH